MNDRPGRDELRALGRLSGSDLQLPTAFAGRALTREEEHIARLVREHLARITATAIKTAYAERMVERLGSETYASGMRAVSRILSQQQEFGQAVTSEALERYAALYAEQLIAQTLQHQGALAAIGARRIAELVDQPFDALRDAPPPRGWLQRLLEG